MATCRSTAVQEIQSTTDTSTALLTNQNARYVGKNPLLTSQIRIEQLARPLLCRSGLRSSLPTGNKWWQIIKRQSPGPERCHLAPLVSLSISISLQQRKDMQVQLWMLLLVLPRAISGSRNHWGRGNNYFEDTLKIIGHRSGKENSREKVRFDDVFTRLSPPRLLSTNDMSTCTPASCGGKPDIQLWEEVNLHYKNLFYSPQNITKMNSIETEPKSRSQFESAFVNPGIQDTNDVNHDFDQCCRTNRAFQTKFGVMRDINNVECSVISFGNMFQVASVGICSSSTAQGCPGTCRPEMSPVHFLCVNKAGQLEFRLFNVEAYCSCKAN